MNKLLKFLLCSAIPFYADDPDGGGAAKPEPKEPQTFSLDYVRELREENKAWRLKHEALSKDVETHKGTADKAAADAKAATETANKAANERILRAELKTAALKAGMVDLDGLKLADISKVMLKDDGEVEGADALMEEMKKSKPYLFGAPNTTSTTVVPPTNKPPEAKKATEMTDAEYAAARAKIK